jgi:type I restriction enzyme, S subunit
VKNDRLFILVLKTIDMGENSVGTSVPSVSQSVEYLILPLPPLNEQMRIVKRINDLYHKCDELISKLVKEQTTTSLLNKSIFERLQDYNDTNN